MKVLDYGFVELVSKTRHVGPLTVGAARCSYGGGLEVWKEDKDVRLVKYLLKHGHTSPFRHAFFTFHIKAPLFVFRQWWKYQVGSTWREYGLSDGTPVGVLGAEEINDGCHVEASDIQIDTDQGCSWNELSGRYKVMEPEFYMPEKARMNSGKQASVDIGGIKARQLTADMQLRMGEVQDLAVAQYNRMLEDGVARELARIVLPPSIYSEAFWTVSLQAVLHFLDQRLEPDAQLEIREYASAVLELIKPDLKGMGIDV